MYDELILLLTIILAIVVAGFIVLFHRHDNKKTKQMLVALDEELNETDKELLRIEENRLTKKKASLAQQSLTKRAPYTGHFNN